ncbi:MAG TPA: SelB C-terminal domain-containing protein, partial [Oscillatoriaceae cyanobacterium]
LDRDAVAPGETAPAQLVLEKPVVAEYGDRFVLRLYSPARLIGGGCVMHPDPAKHKRKHAGTLAALEHLQEGDPIGAMAEALRHAGRAPLSKGTLLGYVPGGRHEEAIAWLEANAFAVEGGYLHGESAQAIAHEITQALGKYHQAMAWRLGLTREELAQRTRLPLGIVSKVAASLVTRGELRQHGRCFALASHTRRLPAEIARAESGILTALAEAPLADKDDFAALGAGDKLGALLDDLVEAGKLLRISGGVYAAAPRLAEMKARLQAEFAGNQPFTASQARELLATNRKYVIPFLEFLDSQGITKRQGDVRVVIGT